MTDETRDRILGCTTLPTLPAIAVQVLELAQKDEVDLNEIASKINHDPALAGKILKTVNSSFYGRSNAVATVSHALVILGLQSVKTLVLGFSLVGNLSKERSKTFDHMKYWRRAIFSATAVRLISAKVNHLQQEEAFLAMLLGDIGVLVLERVFESQYHETYAKAESHHDLSAIEASVFGTTHAEVGALIAGNWKLPPILVKPIAAHHAPDTAGDPALTKVARLVELGGRCGDVFVDKNPAQAILDVRELTKVLASDGSPALDPDALLAEIGQKTSEAAKLFEISLNGAELDFGAIMRKANDALVELTLRSQMQATQLAEQNEQLKVKATTDRLTGLANRAAFEEFFADKWTASGEGRRPLSLIMLDVDKFKSINDQHGHPVGDAVLKHIGTLLRGIARDGDMAARYGGEEMVLVLPDTPRSMAATVAETLRRGLSARPVSTEAGGIPVTASFGVATMEYGAPFKAAAHLLKAADLAVYKAKHSGRNNVKVFAPAGAKAA